MVPTYLKEKKMLEWFKGLMGVTPKPVEKTEEKEGTKTSEVVIKAPAKKTTRKKAAPKAKAAKKKTSAKKAK